MKFAYTRLVTEDLPKLVSFYEQLLETKPGLQTEKFVSFPVEGATLWLFSREAVEEFNGGKWVGGQNHSLVLEFEVPDVDGERERLAAFVTEWVQEPKTMPWGNRSMVFRDPDGNAINFFKRAATAA